MCLILLGSCSLAQNQEQVLLKVMEEEHRVEVYIGGELFTAYRYEATLEKPVLYPVNAPGGITVSRGFPLEPRGKERIDHPHQVGLWFNFGDVNGMDFWNNSMAVPDERKGYYGRIIHQGIEEANSGNKIGVLEVNMDWVAPDNEQAEKLLQEHEVPPLADEQEEALDEIMKAAQDELVR